MLLGSYDTVPQGTAYRPVAVTRDRFWAAQGRGRAHRSGRSRRMFWWQVQDFVGGIAAFLFVAGYFIYAAGFAYLSWWIGISLLHALSTGDLYNIVAFGLSIVILVVWPLSIWGLSAR